MKNSKKYYKLSFTGERTKYYEAEDGEIVAYRGGTINKTNLFMIGRGCKLIRSLALDKGVIRAYQVASSDICVERM